MFVRHLSRCKDCPLRDRTRVWGQGNAKGLVLIGEAPGADEDSEGVPFAGRAGKFLTWGLFQAGIQRSTAWLTNVLSCRPPSNDIDSEEALEALACCKPGFDAELQYLHAQGAQVLVPLGGTACRALGLEQSITKVRGSVYLHGSLVVVPTFHPSYIMRAQFKKETSEVTYKYVWIADLAKAQGMLASGWQAPRETFLLRPSREEALAWMHACVVAGSLVGVDIETSPQGIVVVGLSRSGTEALSVPLLRQGGYPYWVEDDYVAVQAGLNELFQRCPLMFQNALYDVPRLKEAGFAIDFDRVQEDTLILHHAVSPELPHNLAFIVSIYGQTPFWKDSVAARKVDLLALDDETLRTYNLRDAAVLHQVLPGLLADLRETGSEAVYREEALGLLPVVAEMVQTGFLLDAGRLEALKHTWKQERASLQQELLKGLPASFNLDSDEDLRWFLYGIKPAKFKDLEVLREYSEATKTGKKVRRSGTLVHQKLLALKDLSECQPVYRLEGWHGRRTAGGKQAVNKQGLLGFQIQLQNRLKQVKDYKHARFKQEAGKIEALLRWLGVYRKYAELSKLLSTYTDYPLGPTGRVHTQFLVHGTTTGRLSSRKPNLQNLPKKRKEARSPFVASPGCTLLSADYSNLEVRILAYETNDENLLAALAAGVNVHDENTQVLFQIGPKHPRWDVARRASKIFMFGGISYGGSDAEIHEKISLECPEIALTRSDYRDARRRWMLAHPAYVRWSERVRRDVHTSRTTSTFLGRVRTLHGSDADIEKEALNTPIQGGAAHVINRAMIRIHARKKALRSKLLVQVHDQLVYEVPDEELPQMTCIVREEMERPLDYRGTKASFPVDISTGSNWASLEAELPEESDET